MGTRLDGWKVGRWMALGVLVSNIPTFPLSAQVGHDPGNSPYHDVPKGAAWVATAGYLGGGRGSVGVGLSNGVTGGIRYEVPLGAIGASLGIAYGRTTSFVVDAN